MLIKCVSFWVEKAADLSRFIEDDSEALFFGREKQVLLLWKISRFLYNLNMWQPFEEVAELKEHNRIINKVRG